MELKLEGTKSWFGMKSVQRTLPDGRVLQLEFRMFNIKLTIQASEDALMYDDGYCFYDLDKAVLAFGTWDGNGDPDGWFRHPATSRRRPNGDPSKEYLYD